MTFLSFVDLTSASTFTGSDVEDLIDTLTDERDDLEDQDADDDDNDGEIEVLNEQIKMLKEFLEELQANSSDWRHETVIADDHFVAYAQDIADELSDADFMQWPFDCIDWEKAADRLKEDYNSADLDGEEFWIRIS